LSSIPAGQFTLVINNEDNLCKAKNECKLVRIDWYNLIEFNNSSNDVMFSLQRPNANQNSYITEMDIVNGQTQCRLQQLASLRIGQ
uniref:Uncharacterized protein n=1 Tax=Romanomermis culicivorax TaxID=13658 RepID=A0A915L830_ROMCU